MHVTTTSSNERTVTIETTLEELSKLHAALTRKKRTSADIQMLHELAALIEACEPNLLAD